MKRIAFPLLAAIAVTLAPLSYAQSGPQSQMQPAPQTESPPAPATDPPAAAETQAASPASGNTRLAALVPTGLTPEDACRGFKDMSECSAALHVAQNLNIPFADLKDRMTSGQSLPTAIRALKPKADSRREAKRAEEQARQDLRSQG
ncbi:MAG TPA: hypothetical protein VEU78_04825 [Steroidobacteraceae bacterium]|nr:hypothetical protein [Steroidobacteraceae bacterium]